MKKLALPLITLLAFSAYTLYVMLHAEQSLLQFGMQLMSRPDTAQVVIDLYILAALACVWMYRDGRARGKSLLYLLPFFALTVIFVSVGPLLYLVLRALPNPASPYSDAASGARQ
ncbi:DUF2834 domain-containing protein [Pseudomonas anguilliseptica]|uniref:DUF2834 domain-containing protein n=1 Tax=Pseudomonas anguilliseptica TaxID=53406 RepID=A0A1H4WSG2_PSEAG|nr:DUF2834 domain-containing protein [Pseudomonas anguilliseptica]SEC96312.1 Protein of unknown function [Pseudomonas anguilliseptica]